MKKTLKTLIAVILAAAMLAACGAKTEDASADLGNNLTRAADEAAETADEGTNEKEEKVTDKYATPILADTSSKSDSDSNSNEDVFKSKTTVFYEGDIFDVNDIETGEHLLRFTKDELRKQNVEIDRFLREECGLLVFQGDTTFDGEKKANNTEVYIDAKGKVVRNPAKKLPDDISGDYLEIKNGLYIATDSGESYEGLKKENGDIVADIMYQRIIPNDDYTYFFYDLNAKCGVMDAEGNIIIKGVDSYSVDPVFTDKFIIFDTDENALIFSYDGTPIITDEYDGSIVLDNGTVARYGIDDYDGMQIIDTSGKVIKTIDNETVNGPITTHYYFNTYWRGALNDLVYPTIDATPVAHAFPVCYYEENSETGEGKYYINLFDGDFKPLISRDLEMQGDRYDPMDYTCYYSNDYTSLHVTNGAVHKTYIFDKNNNLINTGDGKLGLINNSLLYESAYGNFYDFDFNLLASVSDPNNDYQNYGNAVVFKDRDFGTYGMIVGNKVVVEPKYTSIQGYGGVIYQAKRGSDTIWLTATGKEFDIPEMPE